MKLCELAQKYGIEELPEWLSEYYDENAAPHFAFDRDFLLDVEERLGAFTSAHIDNVLSAAEDIKKDKDACAWLTAICKYLETCDGDEARLTRKLIPANYAEVSELYPLFALVAMIPRMEAVYRAHGFDGEALRDNFRVFEISLRLSGIAQHKPAFTLTYYYWSMHYTLCEIFDYGSFNFQIKKLGNNVKLFRNKNTGEYVLFQTEGTMHREGKTLGDAGFTDEEGSFTCEFTETDDEYIGNPAVNNRISKERIAIKKADYVEVLNKDDEVIGLHIPRNVDFSPEAIEASLRGAVEIIKNQFPEWKPKMYVCSSWLLDPGLEDLLGSESRIVKFGKMFKRYPGGVSNGRGGYSFVFLGYEENEDLPEDTSLRRKLKAHYLSGGYTYFCPGIICDESYFA
jgi:hypothetical protein